MAVQNKVMLKVEFNKRGHQKNPPKHCITVKKNAKVKYPKTQANWCLAARTGR